MRYRDSSPPGRFWTIEWDGHVLIQQKISHFPRIMWLWGEQSKQIYENMGSIVYPEIWEQFIVAKRDNVKLRKVGKAERQGGSCS